MAAGNATGEVILDVGGKAYTLILDIQGICALEDLFSTPDREVSFHEVLARVQRNSVRHIRGIVWASLRRHHASMSLEDAGDLIQQAGGLAGFSKKLEAIAKSTQPDQEDVAVLKKKGRPQKAQPH